MPNEPLVTFRVRADVLLEAHSVFHAAGLLQSHLTTLRRYMPLPVPEAQNLIHAGKIDFERASKQTRVGPSDALRSLRLWHWKQARTASKAADDSRASRHTKEAHEAAYSLHMAAVQALNDCFPADDTAEDDEDLQDRNLRRAAA